MKHRSLAADRSLKRRVIASLEAFRREKGDVISVNEIETFVLSLLANETNKTSAADLALYEGLQSLSSFIATMRQEVVALKPQEISRQYIPAATDELDAIIEATETATNIILDSTEAIEQLQDKLSADDASLLAEATTKIYEACNFQDITGQRITKIVGSLHEIENRISKLTEAFRKTYDGAEDENTSTQASLTGEEKVLSDEDLLNGPQLPSQAKKQDEVDALFLRDK